MNVKELQDALRTLESAFNAGGASKQAREISDLIAALDSHADTSLEEFAEAASSRMQPKRRSEARDNEVSMEVVAAHTDCLFAAGNDRALFDQAFGNLKSDKMAKFGEVTEIARRYRNQPTGATHPYKFDSKTKALDFIFATYMSRADAENRLNIIDQMTRWANG